MCYTFPCSLAVWYEWHLLYLGSTDLSEYQFSENKLNRSGTPLLELSPSISSRLRDLRGAIVISSDHYKTSLSPSAINISTTMPPIMSWARLRDFGLNLADLLRRVLAFHKMIYVLTTKSLPIIRYRAPKRLLFF